MTVYDLPCDMEARDECGTVVPFPPSPHAGRVVYLSLWRGAIEVPRGPTLVQIAQEVAEYYGLTVDELKGPSHARAIAWPRQEAMARMRAETRNSSTAIGKFLGGRDHSTVLTGVQAHQARIPSSLNVPVRDNPAGICAEALAGVNSAT